MKQIIVILTCLIFTLPTFAEIITTTIGNPYQNAFPSMLNTSRTQYNTFNHSNPNYYRHKNYNKNYHPKHKYNRFNRNQYNYRNNQRVLNNNFEALEKYIFNKTYNRNNDLERLERLENVAFGAIQNGDLQSRYYNVETALLSRPNNNNIKRNIIGKLANYISGQPTGLTPSISDFSTLNQYSNFSNPSFGQQRIQQYSNGIFGSGWGISEQNLGRGTSIHMLD